jgi:hypothetical protein
VVCRLGRRDFGIVRVSITSSQVLLRRSCCVGLRPRRASHALPPRGVSRQPPGAATRRSIGLNAAADRICGTSILETPATASRRTTAGAKYRHRPKGQRAQRPKSSCAETNDNLRPYCRLALQRPKNCRGHRRKAMSCDARVNGHRPFRGKIAAFASLLAMAAGR